MRDSIRAKCEQNIAYTPERTALDQVVKIWVDYLKRSVRVIAYPPKVSQTMADTGTGL